MVSAMMSKVVCSISCPTFTSSPKRDSQSSRRRSAAAIMAGT
jgi:hypothetical protein